MERFVCVQFHRKHNSSKFASCMIVSVVYKIVPHLSFRLHELISKEITDFKEELATLSEEDLAVALHLVLSQEHLDMCKVTHLLNVGASIHYEHSGKFHDVEVRMGQNALQIAVKKHGNLKCVKLILDHCEHKDLGQLIDHLDVSLASALNIAVSKENIECAMEIVNYRLKAEPKLNMSRLMIRPKGITGDYIFYTPTTPLDIAAQKGLTKLVKHFISLIEEECRQESINLSFREAVFGRQYNCARTCLQMGADVNYQPQDGLPYSISPLGFAAQHDDMDMVELLVEDFGANVNLRFKHIYGTALCKAIPTKNLDLVEFLLKHGADVNQKVEDGLTPFLLSIRTDAVEITKKLVECGTFVDKYFDYSLQAMHLAAANRRSQCLAYMLRLQFSHKYDVNCYSDKCGTPLTVAARYANYENVEALLKHGAYPNKTDSAQRTPLACAMFSFGMNKPKYSALTVLNLIQHGADVNIGTQIGHCSYHETLLGVAIGLRVLPLAHILWNAGCSRFTKLMWFSCRDLWYTKEKMLEFVKNVVEQPRSLLCTCRNVIRKALGGEACKLIVQLQVPEPVRDYINLSDIQRNVNELLVDFPAMYERYMTEEDDWEPELVITQAGAVRLRNIVAKTVNEMDPCIRDNVHRYIRGKIQVHEKFTLGDPDSDHD